MLKHDGLLLRRDADFSDLLDDFVRVSSFLHSPILSILLHRKGKPAFGVVALVEFPQNVAVNLNEELDSHQHEIFWELGYPC